MPGTNMGLRPDPTIHSPSGLEAAAAERDSITSSLVVGSNLRT